MINILVPLVEIGVVYGVASFAAVQSSAIHLSAFSPVFLNVLSIDIPVSHISINSNVVDIIQSCYVAIPDDVNTDPETPVPVDGGIFTPVPPGVTFASLIPEPDIYDTTPLAIIGCINDVGDNPQGRLNALFPTALASDGVVERFNNNIWMFDGTIWVNVGPNPGQTFDVITVIPPWDEVVEIEKNVKTILEVRRFDYTLTPLQTILAPIVSTISATIHPAMPVKTVNTAAVSPSINARGIPDPVSIGLVTPAPIVSISAKINVSTTASIQIIAIPPANVGLPALIIFVPTANLEITGFEPNAKTEVIIRPATANLAVTAFEPFFADYGQQIYASAGSYDFTVPDNVFSVSVVVVAGGGGSSGCPGGSAISGAGGGGGALAWVNNISVTPGETLTAIVGQGGAGGATTTSPGSTGGESALLRGATYLCHALGGQGGPRDGTRAEYGIPLVTDAAEFDGEGGYGGRGTANQGGGGGGGAGGYTGFGGNGGATNTGIGGDGTGGSGGGGGGQSTGGTPNNAGGGVGIFGEGTNGIGGAPNNPGTGGSSGGTGRTGGLGGLYGGGGGGVEDDTSSVGFAGGGGAVRIIWGPGRVFPSATTAAIPIRKVVPLVNVDILSSSPLVVGGASATVSTNQLSVVVNTVEIMAVP